jgi:hypothetical protein
MRIISLALRQRIFGSIRKEENCTIWCGDPKDAMIFQGKKHGVHEIAFHLFCEPLYLDSLKDSTIAPCRHNDLCIAPNHLGVYLKGERRYCEWGRPKIGLVDRKDISDLYTAGVSKRTLKQWYMLETDELDYVLRNDHVLRKPLK